MVERTIQIEAPIQTVYDVIADLESYPDFLDTTSRVYTLEFSFQKPEGLSWTFVEGDMMKDNVGGWRLSPIDDSTTEATYFVDVQFGWMVPKKIVKLLTETQLPSLLQSFKKRAESAAKRGD